MPNIIKKIITIILILQIIFAIENVSQASFWDDIFTYGGNFVQDGKDKATSGEIVIGNVVNPETGEVANITMELPSDTEIKNTINNIYNILFPLAVVITVAVGGILGTKFMLESAENKAKVKESLVPYVAGCIAIYGAFGIWKLAIIVFSSIG